MENFVFQNTTKIYFGTNQLNHLGEEIKVYGNKVLLVYGGGSIKKIGLYQKVIKELKKNNILVFELPGVEPNPRHTTINKGALICKKNKIDVVLAVGGGSTIDASKGIAATACYKGNDVWDLVKHKASVSKTLPLITILTLSASGSEMDEGAVISNIDTKEKLGLFVKGSYPKVSFLDPTNTYSVNQYQTACGSVDIMSHIFDVGYFNTNNAMDMLTNVQESVLKTVVKYAPIAMKNPDNYEARANLMWASSWALNDFLYDGTTTRAVVHAMEHELSAFYDITHGHGLAILTPRYLRYVLNKDTAPKIKRFGINIFNIDKKLGNKEGAIKAIEALEKFFFKTLKLPAHLKELKIDETNFKIMASKACNNKTLNGFISLTSKDIENIYKMCL